jgi:DNA-binding beta-propeller fold protein YncE
VGFYSAGSAPPGGRAHEIVRSPGGKYLYVSDNGILCMTYAGQGKNTISIIDVEKRAKADVIQLGEYRRPHGMDFDPKSNRIAVMVENPHGLLLIDLASRKALRTYDTGGKAPHMVLFSRTGQDAYVSNTESNSNRRQSALVDFLARRRIRLRRDSGIGQSGGDFS